MKRTIKQSFGVFLSFVWFIVYVGGGSYLFAHKATHNINLVPSYTPLLVFAWIAGFFVGHVAIEKFFLIFLRLERNDLATGKLLENLNIDNLDIHNGTIYVKDSSPSYNYIKKTNNNFKKSTGKIPKYVEPSANFRKVYRVGLQF